MEPEPLTPGTSYGPPPFISAQTFLNCTLQSSCSPNVSDGLMSWGHSGDEGSKQSECTQPSAEPGTSTPRRFRSSAFPSSLSWDSDSEKETLDGNTWFKEELQHFSNPHGLAAHSPGSPSSGLRLDSEDDPEAENVQHLHSKTDASVEVHADNDESAETQEPNTSQLGPTRLADSKVWSVSGDAELFLSNIKPKDGCQIEEEEEADDSGGEKRSKEKETKQPERDVYTFPGDSDSESPPPAPWAHCTFIQRCKKKRALLRPFSGLGTLKRMLPETGEWARMSPPKPKTTETAQPGQGAAVYDFGGAVEESMTFRDRGGKRGESGLEPGKEIFTCVECSIYFNKQVHLQEHMAEHCQGAAGGGRRLGKAARFRCIECGWSLPNRLTLVDHQRRHEESRLKILEEIEKLNDNEKARETEKLDRKVVKHKSPDPAVVQDASPELTVGKSSDPEIVTSPPLSPAPVSTPEAGAAVVDSDITPPNSVRSRAQARVGSTYRRRFVCSKCNFSTRTSQALANHSKTHNRKKPTLQVDSPRPGSPSCLLPPSLACGHCAFLTSSQTVLREHQKIAHPGGVSISRPQADETGPHPRSNVASRISTLILDSNPQGVADSEDSTGPDGAAARPAAQLVLRCAGNRRLSRRGKIWMNLSKFHPKQEDEELPGSDEEEQGEDQSTELDTELPQEEANSPGAAKPRTRTRSNTGGEEEAAEEEDEEELRLHSVEDLSPGKTGLCGVDAGGLSPGEDADAKVHSLKCEVCGAQFETRRGLSSHARSHLRQLGVSVSESSGAPIDLLYQIAKERGTDGQISSSLLEPLPAKNPSPPVPQEDEDLEDMDLDEKPVPFSVLAKAAKAAPASSSSTPTPSPGASPAPSHSASPSPVVRKAPISSLLPVSSPLRSPEHKAGGMKSLSSNLSAPNTITAKPLWAPQENDAPLNLTMEVDPSKDIVCQLCGAWFETRKGLSSHARAHLRHFGVEYSESKGSPIDLLNQLIDSEDFKHKASALQLDDHAEPQGLSTSSSSPKQSLPSLSSSSSSSLLYKVATGGGGSTSKATSSSASSLLGPPAKRLKSSSMQVFRLSSGELMALPHSEPPKEIGCEFCGEYFENRKGLSSHARSHLRQMGITEWSVNGSPIDTLREVITRRGLPCALPVKPHKTPPPSSPGPPRSPLSTSSSPSAAVLSRLPFTFARPSSPPQPAGSKSSSAPPASGLILKLKPEPVQLEVSAQGAAGRSGGFSAEPLNCSWNSSDSVFPLNLAMAHEVEPTRDIRCEFCGEYFENRKGLSSHARSHLRQMGITEWSVNGSPIDTLREVMQKRGVGASSHSDQAVKKESSQEASSPQWENPGGASSSEGLGVSGFQSSRFRKSPLSLLQSGSRLHKQGLGSVGPSATSPVGKFFRMSPLGKRPLSEEALSVETPHSSPHRLKNFSPVPREFSFKRKPSPDKHGHQDPSCELCGFCFENRKALASHARAHLRQFGVTEWCVNGSPIETLSAWMRSRPQKVLEMHRSYMQGSRSTLKKKSSSPLAASVDSDHILPVSPQKASSSSSSSSSQWSSSLAVSLVRPLSREVGQGSSRTAEGEARTNLQPASIRPGLSSPAISRLAGGLRLQAQVARSELNVRLPRGFEHRPLKHPACPNGAERDSGPSKPPRTGTVPALVPKPPSYPLVKLVGKFYTLKCRFCEVEFHGPLSVQEDWIRHLQQHILKMNYNKPAPPRAASAQPTASTDEPAPAQASAPASTSTSSSTSTTPALTSTPTHTPPTPTSCSPTPPAEGAPAVTATEIVKVSEEQPTLTPSPLPTQTV
ncbi:protein Wiz isoform X4 [Mastacembelus armatus]|uniref:protein Wiz isoform X4 n=1 Tax=Mastacembelus armatus TaxID=205130 RepID=UPI000E45BEDB|nr:protein Wiz-like isoform X4 [Mastacembelus armatus]